MKRTLAGLALIAAVGCSSHRAPSAALSPDEAKSVLVDRNWIDRMPETPRDRLHVYRFVPSMGGGVFQDRTIFKGGFELFRFEATADQIRFDFPETQQKLTRAYKIEKVAGPEPFDLKLTIQGDPRGPEGVYYGIRAETDRDGAQLEHRLAATPAP